MGNIGIAIISFNRPDFLEECLNSIKVSVDKNTPIYLFQDGAINRFSKEQHTDNSIIKRCINIFNKFEFENSYTHTRKENVGIAVSQYEATKKMLEKYDYVLIVEDDAILGPTAFNGIKKLINQVKQKYPYICLRSFKPDINSTAEDVHITNVDIDSRAYIIAKQKWESLVEPEFLKFYNHVKDFDYKHLPVNKVNEIYNKLNINFISKGQDAWKAAALQLSNTNALTFGLSRAKHIGWHGTHVHLSTEEAKKRFQNAVTLKKYNFDLNAKDYKIFRPQKTLQRFGKEIRKY